MDPVIKNLIDHIGECGNAVNAALETGSHLSNNRAAVDFKQRYPEIIEWMTQLNRLADTVETKYGHPGKSI